MSANLAGLAKELAMSLVDYPDDVSVITSGDSEYVKLELEVAEDDLGTPHMVRAHRDLGGRRREQRWWEGSAEAPETIDQMIL